MIKDSYSIPPYHEYTWSIVDWENPFPNDLVALNELTTEARTKYVTRLRLLLEANGDPADAPPYRMWLWDHAIMEAGFYDSSEFDEDIYRDFLRFDEIGKYVRDDRMFKEMSDDEMEEHFEQMNRFDEVFNTIIKATSDSEGNDIFQQVTNVHEQREREIKELNQLFGEDND